LQGDEMNKFKDMIVEYWGGISLALLFLSAYMGWLPEWMTRSWL